MNIKQEITITGKNWNDIFQLPCVVSLVKSEKKGVDVNLDLRTSAVQQKLDKLIKESKMDEFYQTIINEMSWGIAWVGDTLVEYVGGLWAVRHNPENMQRVKEEFAHRFPDVYNKITKARKP